MIFKNLTLYSINKGWKPSLQELEKHRFSPCGQSDMISRGWQDVRDGELMLQINNQILLSLETETRLLPASVVAKATKIRAQEIEEREGYKPGRKQLREIRDQVQDELIPKAFTVQSKTAVWISPEAGLLCIDTAAASRADDVLGLLLKSCEGLQISRFVTKMSPVVAMTAWLAENENPPHFTIDQDCELKSRGEQAATVRYLKHSLESEDISKHIQGGKDVTKLAMTWADKVSFVLHENLQLKRVTPLDVIKEQAAMSADDDAFISEFTLMTGEFSLLIDALVESLGGLQPNKD